MNNNLSDILTIKAPEVSLEHVLDNSKAASGGENDVNFLKYLIANNLIVMGEAVLKRSTEDINEEYYYGKYKKSHDESGRHFLCRAIIQDELQRLGLGTYPITEAGNMQILRESSIYDIVTSDFKTIIDVGFTSARNYIRGLTDLRVQNYLITTYFDDYIRDIIFTTFSRKDDQQFLNAVKDYVESGNVPGAQNGMLS